MSDDHSEAEDEFYGIDSSFDIKSPSSDEEKNERVQLVYTCKRWRWVKSGFNYGGHCPNSECISHVQDNGNVMCHRGYGSIRPNEDVSYGVVRCSGCEERFQPTEFIIKRAVGSLTFSVFGDATFETVKICSVVKNHCQVFHENVDPSCYSLMVFVLETPRAIVQVMPTDDDECPKKVIWSRDNLEYSSEMRNPVDIRFSKESIKRKFQCGRLLSHTLWELEREEICVWDIPLITVFKMGDEWYTPDNRRLWVFQQLIKSDPGFRVPVKVIQRYQEEPGNITTTNSGRFVRLRGNPILDD